MTYQNVFKSMFAACFLFACDSVSAQTAAFNTTLATVPTADKSLGHYTAWKPIKESDITYRKRLWQEIDLRDNKELFVRHPTGKDLLDVLKAGEASGKLSVSAGNDDRFLHVFSHKEFSEAYEKAMSGDARITKYIIKKDFLTLKTGEVETRIIAIAPVAVTTDANGQESEAPVFWAFYFDARDIFATYPASAELNWDNVLVDEHFTGKITKVTSHTYDQYPAAKLKNK